jgi:hypothetical protein
MIVHLFTIMLAAKGQVVSKAGGRDPVQRSLDLTSEPGEQVPGRRAQLNDLEIDMTLDISQAQVKMRLKDRLGMLAAPVIYIACTVGAMLPVFVAVAICRLAAVDRTGTQVACLATALVSIACGAAVCLYAMGARHSRDYKPAAAPLDRRGAGLVTQRRGHQAVPRKHQAGGGNSARKNRRRPR